MSSPLRHVQMAYEHTCELGSVTLSLLVSDLFSTATTGLPPPTSVHNSSAKPFSLLQSLDLHHRPCQAFLSVRLILPWAGLVLVASTDLINL